MDTLTAPLAPTADATHGSNRNVMLHLQRSAVYREYQQAFEATTGLPLAMRSAGAFQSPLHDSKLLNPFCAFMAGSNKSCASCLQLQQQIEEGATDHTNTVECFAGLNESAVPIRAGDRVLGYLQTGQIMLRPPTTARYRKTIKQFEEWQTPVDEPALKEAYFKTRVIKKAQYDSVLRLLGIFAQHLSSLGNQILVTENTSDSPVMAKARQYIADHHAGELSLSQVAQAVNMSAFYFCKMFKKATGLTFTDYVARVRIERTKQLLLNPHARVSEAAFEAGFQSLSQFNRVFRRIVGEAPSAYRERLHHRTEAPASPTHS
ncbi:MAG: helix-turn-helix domain-containing protein, partial [Opitutales bacterium]